MSRETVELESVRVLVYGRVQGVFFRNSAKIEADKLGLVGWIRNDADGSVETFVFGPKDKLAQFIKWCKKGPPLAKVENVEVDWSNQQEDFDAFEVI